MKTAQEWVDELALEEHVEGGYFREIVRSDDLIDDNNLYTSILFLLEEDNHSNFHQLTSDEMWYFHDGNSLTVHIIDPKTKKYHSQKLGKNIKNGEVLQLLVPKGMIFGSSVEEGYGLVSCMVAPAFRFEDFKLFSRKELLDEYPQYADIITKLTRE